jgi:hypothetical protein
LNAHKEKKKAGDISKNFVATLRDIAEASLWYFRICTAKPIFNILLDFICGVVTWTISDV